MKVINNKLVQNKSEDTIINEFYQKIYDTRLHLCEATLIRYFELFEQTAQKIKTFLKAHEKDHEQTLHSLQDICHFLIQFFNPQYGSGPVNCARWYHDSLGGFRTNSYFLFGTASQFR